MTRGDRRLLMVIVLTAVTSSVATVAVSRWWSSDPAEPPAPVVTATPIIPPKAVVPTTPDPTPALAPVCDEVGCLLANYEPACCAPFDKHGQADQRQFNAAMVRDAVARVKTSVLACGNRWKDAGEVKVRVRVAPDGRITETKVTHTPAEPLGTCVAAAMAKMRFPATETGGSFSYPFRF